MVHLILEEFGKIKDEVPPLLTEAHTKNVASINKNTISETDAKVGLSTSGIAMTVDDDKTTKTISGKHTESIHDICVYY